MTSINKVFIAQSIDGYIADKDGGIDWLHAIPNPENIDMGYNEFMSNVDALVMGRITFETVCDFDMDWPYQKPVFVLSNSMTRIPDEYKDKAHLVSGDLKKVVQNINGQGYQKLYIDGGRTIQSFLREDLIDEMVLTTIPVLLGGGVSLFGELPKKLDFRCVDIKLYLESVVQNRFVRQRDKRS